jgi:hypothetical protein
VFAAIQTAIPRAVSCTRLTVVDPVRSPAISRIPARPR